MTYENDFTVSNCYDHHNDVSWRVGLGRDAGRDDFPFYITSHHITSLWIPKEIIYPLLGRIETPLCIRGTATREKSRA